MEDRRVIFDKNFVSFFRKALTRVAKKKLNIQFPWFGINKGAIIIPDTAYLPLVRIYSSFKHVPDFKVDIITLDNIEKS